MVTSTAYMTNHISRVIQIMVEKFGLDENMLSYSSSFSQDLNIDSLDMLEFVHEIEKTFKIKILDEDVEHLTTVGAVVDYIDKHAAQ
jgi:acyl carrier protein